MTSSRGLFLPPHTLLPELPPSRPTPPPSGRQGPLNRPPPRRGPPFGAPPGAGDAVVIVAPVHVALAERDPTTRVPHRRAGLRERAPRSNSDQHRYERNRCAHGCEISTRSHGSPGTKRRSAQLLTFARPEY